MALNSFTPTGVVLTVRGLARFQSDLKRANQSVANVGKKVGTGGAVESFSSIGKAATTASLAVAGALAVMGTEAVKVAISFETAFTGIEKTVDGLDEKLQGTNTTFREFLRGGLVQLSKETPIAFEELAKIGELGGQFGLAKEEIIDFTEVVSELGVATNLSVEEAATQIVRFNNIFATAGEEARGSFRDIGNVIVDLGNNFATTESEILSFAERIASAGQIVGLTQADVLAIGTALSSVGVRAERGSTAIQKTLLKINDAVAGTSKNSVKELQILARTAGISATEFKRVFERDAALGFQLFVEGLGRQGDEAARTLRDLGLADQRLIQSTLALAGAGGLLGEAFQAANAEFKDGSALQEEADRRFATTASQIEIFKNNLRAASDEIGTAFLPALREILILANDLADTALPKLVDAMGEFSAGTQTVTEAATAFQDFSNILAESGVSASRAEFLLLTGQTDKLTNEILEGVQAQQKLGGSLNKTQQVAAQAAEKAKMLAVQTANASEAARVQGQILAGVATLGGEYATRLDRIADAAGNAAFEQSKLNAELLEFGDFGLEGGLATTDTLGEKLKLQQEIFSQSIATRQQLRDEEAKAAEKSAKKIGAAITKAGQDAANAISGVVSKVGGLTFSEILPPEETFRVDEWVRRMQAVVNDGKNEWAAAAVEAFAGEEFIQPLADAVASGDPQAISDAAAALINGPDLIKLMNIDGAVEEAKELLIQQNLQEKVNQMIQEALFADPDTEGLLAEGGVGGQKILSALGLGEGGGATEGIQGFIDETLPNLGTAFDTFFLLTQTSLEEMLLAIQNNDLALVDMANVTIVNLQNGVITLASTAVAEFGRIVTAVKNADKVVAKLRDTLEEVAEAIVEAKNKTDEWIKSLERAAGLRERLKKTDSTDAQRGLGFQQGTGRLGFQVPPGFPNDSFPINVSSGERVVVSPPGRSIESVTGLSAGTGGGVTVNIQATVNNDMDMAVFAARVERVVSNALSPS